MTAQRDSHGTESSGDAVPAGVRIGAAYTGRMLVILLGIVVVVALAVRLSEVVVPFLIALILAALLVPFSSWLQRHHWPKPVAILTAWVVVLGVLAALVALVAEQIRVQLPALSTQVQKFLVEAEQFVDSQPFGITSDQLTTWANEALAFVQSHASQIGLGFADAGLGVVHVVEALFIIVFVTLFALIDGGRMWQWFTRLFPSRAQARIRAAGGAGWTTLTSFIRVQLVVAATDAIGIGIGAAILQIPLAVPIAVVVFFGAFVPVVGAIVTGAIAVVIALIFNGPVAALIMLAIVLVVGQLESHVLHPRLTGSAVKVHPVGVVLGVATGSALAGVTGAFFAVPVIATANAMILAAKRYVPEGVAEAGEEAEPDRGVASPDAPAKAATDEG